MIQSPSPLATLAPPSLAVGVYGGASGPAPRPPAPSYGYLTTQSGSRLLLQDRSGSLTLQAGALAPGSAYGYLTLQDGSRLLLQSGGGLTLQGGAVAPAPGGNILLQNGSRLLLQSGSALVLQGTSPVPPLAPTIGQSLSGGFWDGDI